MRLEIQFDGRDPPVGRVRRADGAWTAFDGWLGLLRILSDALQDDPPPPAG